MRHLLKISWWYICAGIGWLTRSPIKPVVLMYHSFDTTDWKHGVSPAALERQIKYLTTHCTVVPLSLVVDHACNGTPLPPRAVAITVDDGYADTYEVLFPLLQQYQLPATIFLTTDLAPQPKLGNLARPTWEQLAAMVDSGLVTIAVHGHTHTNFPAVLEVGNEATEIAASRALITDRFGQPADVVAYPAGRYDESVLHYVAQAGFKAGFVTGMGAIVPTDHIYTLPRVVIDRSTSWPEFRLRLGRGLGWYVRSIRWFRNLV